jgi:hypothetical protein
MTIGDGVAIGSLALATALLVLGGSYFWAGGMMAFSVWVSFTTCLGRPLTNGGQNPPSSNETSSRTPGPPSPA